METKLLSLGLMSVAVSYICYTLNQKLEQAVEDMGVQLTNLTTTWTVNMEQVDKRIRHLQTLADDLTSQTRHLQTLKKSVEDASFQNRMHALEIKALTQTASEIPSLRKTLNGLEVSVQKLSWQVQKAEDSAKNLEQEMDTGAASLKAQSASVAAVQKQVEDTLRQTHQHALDIASLKDRTSGVASLRKTLSSVEVQTSTMKERLDNVREKTETMGRALETFVKHNQEFREQIQKFKHQVDDYQRSLRDRDPLWDALTGIFNFFRDPFGSRQKKWLN